MRLSAIRAAAEGSSREIWRMMLSTSASALARQTTAIVYWGIGEAALRSPLASRSNQARISSCETVRWSASDSAIAAAKARASVWSSAPSGVCPAIWPIYPDRQLGDTTDFGMYGDGRFLHHRPSDTYNAAIECPTCHCTARRPTIITPAKASIAEYLARLPRPASARWPDGEPFTEAMRHGTMLLEIFAPRGTDHQTPHEQDELYVVLGGTARFDHEGAVTSVESGDVLFVPAGERHHFCDMSDDFVTWVIFWGPQGGERDPSEIP
jgi:mannose-6-phosphate isomerase-like protein (cupin superfamily)